MDAKITLSFDAEVIEKAKEYAASQNISLSRLMEHILRQITSGTYKTLEDFPISDWVSQVAEERAEYRVTPRSRKSMKADFYSKK